MNSPKKLSGNEPLELIKYLDHRDHGDSRVTVDWIRPRAEKQLLSPVTLTNVGWIICEDETSVVLSRNRAEVPELDEPLRVEYTDLVVILKSTIIERREWKEEQANPP